MKAFLAAVDPFHDKPITGLAGWPDQESAPSVVRHWKDTYNVKAIEDGASICVYGWPIMNPVAVDQWSKQNNILKVQSTAPAVVAPVTVTSYTAAQVAAGSLALQMPVFASGDSFETYLADGPSRVIGMGIEVRDVTAEIYKQGTCTVFEIPQTMAETQILWNPAKAGVYLGGFIPAQFLNRWPNTYSSMMAYPSTLQWEAREGAYVVMNANSHENNAMVPEYNQVAVPNASVAIDHPGGANNTSLHVQRESTADVAYPKTVEPNLFTRFNSKGIYLSGLNANSTFNITISYYMETFPLQTSPLLALASPSAPFDPKALALISLANREMPIGCRICDNPSGEWFWETLSTVLPVVGTVASGLFPEFAPLIAPATALAANGAKNQAERARTKKAAKQTIKAEVRKEIKKEVKKDARK